jgi:hypothetical protein
MDAKQRCDSQESSTVCNLHSTIQETFPHWSQSGSYLKITFIRVQSREHTYTCLTVSGEVRSVLKWIGCEFPGTLVCHKQRQLVSHNLRIHPCQKNSCVWIGNEDIPRVNMGNNQGEIWAEPYGVWYRENCFIGLLYSYLDFWLWTYIPYIEGPNYLSSFEKYPAIIISNPPHNIY